MLRTMAIIAAIGYVFHIGVDFGKEISHNPRMISLGHHLFGQTGLLLVESAGIWFPVLVAFCAFLIIRRIQTVARMRSQQ